MATDCPKCGTPGAFSARDVGMSGRLARCSRCATRWLARSFEETGFGKETAGAAIVAPPRREPLVIEGEVVRRAPRAPSRADRWSPPPGSAEAEPRIPRIRWEAPAATPAAAAPSAAASARSVFARTALAAGAPALLLALVAAVLLAPNVAAVAGLFAPEGVTLQSVQSRVLTLRGSEAIFVEGELVNRSSVEMDVPAVRVSLRDGGSEVYSWLVEPTRERVSAGGAIGFRSALARPANVSGEVTLSLADRAAPAAGAR